MRIVIDVQGDKENVFLREFVTILGMVGSDLKSIIFPPKPTKQGGKPKRLILCEGCDRYYDPDKSQTQ